MSAESAYVSKLQVLQARYAASQFVYELHPRTLLPLDLAASAIGKTVSTFRSDLCRRPESLPPVVRRGGRVWVLVGDLLTWLDTPATPVEPDPDRPKRGRPTKAVQLARQRAQEEQARREGGEA